MYIPLMAPLSLLDILWRPSFTLQPISPPEWYKSTNALITQGPHWLLSAPDLSPGAGVMLEHTTPHSGIFPRHRWIVAREAQHTLIRAYGSNLCLSLDHYSDGTWAPVSGDNVVLVHCPTTSTLAGVWEWERRETGHSFALRGGEDEVEARFWLNPPDEEGTVGVTDRWWAGVEWRVERLDFID